MRRARLVALARSERVFLVALAVGVVVRVLVVAAFPPGFVHSDGPTYLGFVDHLAPGPDHPLGYGMFLWLLARLAGGVVVVTAVQHLLGLAAAVAGYWLLRRWSVRPWLATVAVLPLLFDQMQLVMEHTVLADVVFELVLVLAVAALAWWRTPPMWAVAVAGSLFAVAVLVRFVGEPAVLAGAAFCVAAAGTWAARLKRVLVLGLCFVLPLVGYAGWYDADRGAWAINQASGRFWYMRSTTFVDCSTLALPDYERALCPPQPLGRRLDPTMYGWRYRSTLPPLILPSGVTRREALRDFGMRAIRAQPLDYAETVARDVALMFWPRRTDVFEYQTAHKWTFHDYVEPQLPPRTRRAYLQHGGRLLEPRQPLAGFLDAYDDVYLPGPLLLALLAVALAGLAVRRPGVAPVTRPVVFLPLALGIGLAIAPAVVMEFVWRYQLPAIVLVPVAAALGWTRLRARPVTREDGRVVERPSDGPAGQSGATGEGDHADV